MGACKPLRTSGASVAIHALADTAWVLQAERMHAHTGASNGVCTVKGTCFQVAGDAKSSDVHDVSLGLHGLLY